MSGQTVEVRLARLEGIVEQIGERLNGIERRLDSLEHTMNARFAQVEARFAQLEQSIAARFAVVDQRFMWLTGIMIGTWITTILTILFHH